MCTNLKLTETKDGTIVEVFVKPSSPKFSLNLEGDEIVVRCTEEPVKGKVNKELLKALSKVFHETWTLYRVLPLDKKCSLCAVELLPPVSFSVLFSRVSASVVETILLKQTK